MHVSSTLVPFNAFDALKAVLFALVLAALAPALALAGPPQGTPAGADVSPVSSTPAEEVRGQWIVTLEAGASLAPEKAAARAADRTGGTVLAVYEHALKGFAIRGASKMSLERMRGVASVEPDLIVHAFAQTLPTGVDRIEGDANTTANIDGSDERVDVDVAVIDTGVDLDHPDLNVHVGVDCTRGPNCQKGGDGNDGNGHGTHVAGTIGALDNGDGVVGVAPGARIWAVQVLRSDGSGFLSDVIEGIDYVTANAGEIEVANMSLGAQGKSDSFRSAIAGSVSAGVFHAVAAGNSSMDVYGGDGTFNTNDDIIPAAYPEVAAISAFSDTDGAPGGSGPLSSWGGSDRNNDGVDDGADDSFAFFSNFSKSVVTGNPVSSPGAAIDLLLPGVDIRSTWVNGGYDTISGTSMASPHGAGLAALYAAENGRATDGAGVSVIRQALIDAGTAQDSSDGLAILNDPDSKWEHVGWAAVGGAPAVSISSPLDGATISGTVTVSADASDSDGSVTEVEFFVDGSSIGTDTDDSDGWGIDWDTTTITDGEYTVAAEATDDDGKSSADSITVRVDNNAAPTVAITSPLDGAIVSDSTVVSADASDTDGSVTEVEFFVDGSSIGTDTDDSDGWGLTWDSTTVSDGEHTLSAEATDDSGERASHSITVTVDNVDESQESGPAVDSLSIAEDNSGGSPHADFTISWAVSDSDGDLSSVALTLRDLDTGEIEESTSVSVSGGSASGTNSLKAKFDEGNGHTYEVELVATDANGNTATATATEVEDDS